MTDVYYVVYNTLTGALLDVSLEPLSTEGAPLIAKPMMGDLPDPLYFYWDRNSCMYQAKDKTRIMTHIDFRRLFTQEEEEYMDEFNDTYMLAPLSPEMKRKIRTGLKRYNEASVIDLDNPGVAEVLYLYTVMGILGPGRMEQVLSNTLIKT